MRHPALCLTIVTLLVMNSSALACPMCGNSPTGNDGSVAGFNGTTYFMIGGFAGCLLLVIRTIIKGIRRSAAHSTDSTSSPQTSSD